MFVCFNHNYWFLCRPFSIDVYQRENKQKKQKTKTRQDTPIDQLGSAIAGKADVAVLDINEHSEECFQIFQSLKDKKLEEELIIIGISTVLTWNQTVKSSKKTLKESNYKSRKSSVKYKNARLLETLILSAQKENLFTCKKKIVTCIFLLPIVRVVQLVFLLGFFWGPTIATCACLWWFACALSRRDCGRSAIWKWRIRIS